MKTLSDLELSKINTNDLEFQLISEKAKVVKLEIRLLEATAKLISYDMEKKRQNLDTLSRQESQAREQRAELLKTIAKKKRLSPGWGFNPDNGEIIEGEI